MATTITEARTSIFLNMGSPEGTLRVGALLLIADVRVGQRFLLSVTDLAM
jgi:hypothetical protein